MAENIDAERAAPALLPCPWCGGAARIESNRDWHRLYAAHDDECVRDADEPDLMYPAMPEYLAQIAEDWNRRTPSASIGEDGLPELQECAVEFVCSEENGASGFLQVAQVLESGPLFTADQMRQFARDAVAAYKRKHAALQEMADIAQANDMGYGPAAQAAQGVKTWQERQAEAEHAGKPALSTEQYMYGEIADLRAQLARQSQGVNMQGLRDLLHRFKHHPAHTVDENDVVAWIAKRLQTQSPPVARVTNEPGYFDLESLIPDEKWPAGVTDLYAAPPLSGEQQADVAPCAMPGCSAAGNASSVIPLCPKHKADFIEWRRQKEGV